MAEKLNSLISETYKQKIELQQLELEKQKAEIKTLQTQIDPHFLYNTLEAIHMHSVVMGYDDIGDMLVFLSKMFKYNLAPETVVEIQNEIDYCNNYIKLLNMRLESSIELYVDLSEEILKTKTIKMILQPVLENSVKHGFRKTYGGVITLRGSIKENDVILEISDDGSGINEERLKEIKKELQSDQSDGSNIGLNNINSRLSKYYGEKYGVDIKSDGNGTTVIITLPRMEEIWWLRK